MSVDDTDLIRIRLVKVLLEDQFMDSVCIFRWAVLCLFLFMFGLFKHQYNTIFNNDKMFKMIHLVCGGCH